MANPILDWFGFTTQGDDMSQVSVFNSPVKDRSPIQSPLLSERQAAEYLRKSTRALFTLRKERKISYIKDGQHVRYKQAHLDAYIDAHTIQHQEVN